MHILRQSHVHMKVCLQAKPVGKHIFRTSLQLLCCGLTFSPAHVWQRMCCLHRPPMHCLSMETRMCFQHAFRTHRVCFIDLLAGGLSDAKESFSWGTPQNQQHSSSCPKRFTPVGDDILDKHQMLKAKMRQTSAYIA